MKVNVNFDAIQQLFKQAKKEGHDFLYEHEVYDLVRHTGAESVPIFHFLPKKTSLDHETLSLIPGNEIVVKVVSPYILHKSDVGGVVVVAKDLQKISLNVQRMLSEVPENYASLLTHDPGLAPDVYKGLSGDPLISAISNHIKGFILCRFIHPDSQEFGNQLFVSLRRTREFGMIISAGLGGTDTELYAERFKTGQAVVSASTEMTDGNSFFKLFRKTVSYNKLAGLTRSRKRVVTDDQLLECFSAFIALARKFSPSNSYSPFVIEELEINPFAFSKYQMIPLDGLCRFSALKKQMVSRPLNKIEKLLHPFSIGVIGVSAEKMNVGRIILRNIVDTGFDKSKLLIVHPKADQIDGVRVVRALDSINEKLDLLVLAVRATDISNLVEHVIDNDLAESVLIIPGGLGEKEGMEGIRCDIQKKIQVAHLRKDLGPVFVGENSLGILSQPGRFDTLFIPETKLAKHHGKYPRKTALISQSGAYMITRMSKLSFLDPAYAISIGNQIDLTAGDFMQFVNTLEKIKIVSVYMEGFVDLDGLAFATAVRQAVKNGKQVLFYKAGRTPAGKTAMTSHTASIAGDYMVCDSCIEQAGAMVARSFTEFDDLLRLACTLQHKNVNGNRLAAVSNAGYEAVGIADNILGEVYQLEMASLTFETRNRIEAILEKAQLSTLIDVRNPLDITPMANEEVYESVVKALLKDPGVDVVVAAIVPLAPNLQTLPDRSQSGEPFKSETNIARKIPRLAEQFNKPLVMVIDSGPLYNPLADALQKEGVPVFRSADQAVRALRRYVWGRLRAQNPGGT